MKQPKGGWEYTCDNCKSVIPEKTVKTTNDGDYCTKCYNIRPIIYELRDTIYLMPSPIYVKIENGQLKESWLMCGQPPFKVALLMTEKTEK